jgi:hypothetical protein
MRSSWEDDIGQWAGAAAIAAAAAFVAISVIAVVWSGRSPAAPAGLAVQPLPLVVRGPVRPARPARPARLAVRQAAMPPSGTTMLAAVRGTSPRYAAPGKRAPGEVPALWWGAPSVLPVVATRPGWVKVRLAQRPNGSTAWLPAGDVTLSSTRYLITIDLATMRLALYSGGRPVFSAPAGVGTIADPTPTPTGHYFVAFTEPRPRPSPGSGPFILVTSAHSQAMSDGEGGGDGVIGIRGPLGDDSLTGTAGARISPACIRLHVWALLKLREVPPGTPIDIVG